MLIEIIIEIILKNLIIFRKIIFSKSKYSPNISQILASYNSSILKFQKKKEE